jgi:hypothetical protein
VSASARHPGHRALRNSATDDRYILLVRHDVVMRDADSNYVCIKGAYAGTPTKLCSQTSSRPTFSKYDVFLGPGKAC